MSTCVNDYFCHPPFYEMRGKRNFDHSRMEIGSFWPVIKQHPNKFADSVIDIRYLCRTENMIIPGPGQLEIYRSQVSISGMLKLQHATFKDRILKVIMCDSNLNYCSDVFMQS